MADRIAYARAFGIAALVLACAPDKRTEAPSRSSTDSSGAPLGAAMVDTSHRLFVADIDSSGTRLCFESPELGTPAGIPVTVVYAAFPQYIVTGTLGTRSKLPCSPPPPSATDSMEYSVTIPRDTSGPTGLPIVVLGQTPKLEMRGDTVTLEIERGKTPWRFRSCASAEGICSSAWSGVPLASPRRWNAYYYLGYDVEPDCQPGDYESDSTAKQ